MKTGEAGEPRRELLEKGAVAVGLRWAEEQRLELHREGRPAAGGWPGTLREARFRTQRFFAAEMRRHKMSAMTEAEREAVARTAYASARSTWCSRAEPETP
jgi:hypothetical protein